MEFLGQLAGLMENPAFFTLPYFIFVYWYILRDRKREGSDNADDGHLGLKLILYWFLVVTLFFAVSGFNTILGYLLMGAPHKNLLLGGLGELIAGGGLFTAIFLLLLPRSNYKDYPRVERFAVGFIAAAAGMMTVFAIRSFLKGLFTGADWKSSNAPQFATMISYGAVAFLALIRYGQMSSWIAPVRPQMPAGYGGGMPQQMPPQQMPQQPQQPQYPPQGGYNPQGGGGYNPQGGGGGLPPPGGSGGGFNPGGGYQPR